MVFPRTVSSSALTRSKAILNKLPRSTRHYQTEAPRPYFYKSHGRALFKSLTMAFLSYQIFYWSWTTLETETMKDEKSREIKSLREEVKLLTNGVNSHLLATEKTVDGNEKDDADK